MLASRGVDPSLNDDIVQEVAVRALDKRVPFTDPDDLYRWAATAARRLHIDHLRSDCRTTGDDSLVSVADGTDVAHVAERRVALGQVWRALAVMRPGERDAILDSLEDREARSSVALVRRHRARASLRKAVGGVIAWATLVQLRLRDLAQPLNATAAAAVLAPAIAIGTMGGTGGPAPTAAQPHVAAEAAAAPAGTLRPPAVRLARPVAARPAAERATRAVRPAAPASSAEDDDSGADPRRVGPLEHDPDPDTEQTSVLCLEQGPEHEPYWCVPDLPRPDPQDPVPGM